MYLSRNSQCLYGPCRVGSKPDKLGSVRGDIWVASGWVWAYEFGWSMVINEGIVGQHLHLGRLVLVAPVRISLDVLAALDLRLLQLPRGRSDHRQDKKEGQDH